MDYIQHKMTGGEHSPWEYFKFALVLVGITATSAYLTANSSSGDITEWTRWFMGVFFAVFGTFKLIGYSMFVEMFAGYDIIAQRFKPYSYAYPFIELGLATLYLANLFPAARDWLTLIIMGVGSIGVFQEIRKRSGIHCACLGNIIKLPLSTVSLVEDLGMGIMALLMILSR